MKYLGSDDGLHLLTLANQPRFQAAAHLVLANHHY